MGKRLKMKSPHYFVIFIVVILSLFIAGYFMMNSNYFIESNTLKGIAFDVKKRSGYTVYIKENSAFVPYLVLTSDYNGNALLLRKELLDEPRAFDDYYIHSYYKVSAIDKFLNEEFLFTLDPKIHNAIVDSEITITSASSLGVTGTDTEKIVRKVFLLSYTEVGLSGNAVANIEGKPLKYFKDPNNQIAYTSKGVSSWWLRTSDTWSVDTAWGIGPAGSSGSGSVDSKNGIRPAFCLGSNLAIEKSDEVFEGQSVYVIVND